MPNRWYSTAVPVTRTGGIPPLDLWADEWTITTTTSLTYDALRYALYDPIFTWIVLKYHRRCLDYSVEILNSFLFPALYNKVLKTKKERQNNWLNSNGLWLSELFYSNGSALSELFISVQSAREINLQNCDLNSFCISFMKLISSLSNFQLYNLRKKPWINWEL